MSEWLCHTIGSALGRELVERGGDAREPFADIFRFAPDTDAEVVRRFEESAWHHARLVLIAQKVAEGFGMAAGEVRKCDGSCLGPDGKEILPRVEELLEKGAIGIEQCFRARRDPGQVIESNYAEQLGRMRRVYAEEIIEPPHALGERRRGKHPAAAQARKPVGFGKAARGDEI
jgi:hypothetical protein